MSDTQSQKSSATIKTSRHRIRICAYDGKLDGPNYISHANAHHDGVYTEWVPDEPLFDKPWCANWKEIIENPNLTPIGTIPKFQRGVGKQFS